MILTCPSCGTQYFAEDSTFGDSGRSVKCAACGHSWHVHGKAGLDPETPVAVAGGAHEAYRAKVRERRQRRSQLAASMAWTMTAGVFALAITAAVIWRNDVVRVWPESAHAFKAAGLEVNRFGLDFVDIEASRTFDGTTPILTVSGSVTNVSRIAQPGSGVRIGLRDELGVEVASLVTSIDQQEVPPGGDARFTTRLENPPVEAFDLELSFVEPVGGFGRFRGGGRIAAAEDDTSADSGADDLSRIDAAVPAVLPSE